MKWIHFTDKDDNQIKNNGGGQISQEEGGLFVYKYDSNFPIDEAMEIWNRTNYYIIDCDVLVIEFIQESPLNRPEFDEYLIPYEHLNSIKIY